MKTESDNAKEELRDNHNAILKFNLRDPDDRDEFKLMLQANDLSLALWDIAQEVFRPHRKHGYPEKELESLFKKDEDYLIVELLEKKFYEILERHKINL